MFIQRLITTLILVPLVLLAIFYAPWWFLGIVVLLIILTAGNECLQLIPVKSWALQIGFISIMLLLSWTCAHVFYYWLIAGLILWVLICLAILTFPASQSYWGHPVIVAGTCLLLIPLFIQSLIHLYYLPQGKELLVYLLFLIWASDIGAYITGKQWGKHKLIPRVSPGKSWEGVSGGYALALLIAVVGFIYFRPAASGYWFFLALVTITISIFGDLFISILKRRCHLKDTGAIIPGHGGVLDRLDSLIAALPLFYFGLTYLPLGVAS